MFIEPDSSDIKRMSAEFLDHRFGVDIVQMHDRRFRRPDCNQVARHVDCSLPRLLQVERHALEYLLSAQRHAVDLAVRGTRVNLLRLKRIQLLLILFQIFENKIR